MKSINDLKDANGDFLPHLLPVDPTLHWANPPGGTAGRDMRPTFTSTPGPYTGPVPIVPTCMAPLESPTTVTARGGLVPAGGRNIPADYATVGTWFDFFSAKAATQLWGQLGARPRRVPVPE